MSIFYFEFAVAINAYTFLYQWMVSVFSKFAHFEHICLNWPQTQRGEKRYGEFSLECGNVGFTARQP